MNCLSHYGRRWQGYPSDTRVHLTFRRRQELSFYREVPAILAELKRRRIHIAVASRTSAPDL
jgi:magnesium-dependent phosphatase 1